MRILEISLLEFDTGKLDGLSIILYHFYGCVYIIWIIQKDYNEVKHILLYNIVVYGKEKC